MTEDEWRDETDPIRKLDLLSEWLEALEDGGEPAVEASARAVLQSFDAGRRKMDLFSLACCRLVGRDLADDRSWQALEAAERCADGPAADRRGVLPYLQAAGEVISNDRETTAADQAAAAVYHAVEAISDGFGYCRDVMLMVTGGAARAEASDAGELSWARQAEAERAQLRLLEDIFGNPFRPVAVDRTWLTPTVVNLAATAYAERQLPSGLLDRQRLAILADALEDAGCDNADLLAHLRDGGDHVRGCWAIDLLLGKEKQWPAR